MRNVIMTCLPDWCVAVAPRCGWCPLSPAQRREQDAALARMQRGEPRGNPEDTARR